MRKIFFLCALCASVLAVNATEGALPGKFTINAEGDQVVFSQGNLQYVGTWQFATNQWDCFGTKQSDNHRDLFGWGTGDAPNKVSEDVADYATFTDWGTNAITNGGNQANAWRTLTKDEWYYLFYTRENAATLFAHGSVNGVNGLILLPDNWTLPSGASFIASTTQGLADDGGYYFNSNGDNFSHNTYTKAQWAVMEAAGAVFLPCAGYRYGSDLSNVGSGGYFWSATPNDTYSARSLFFSPYYLYPQSGSRRYYGQSVRLVWQEPEKELTGRFSVAAGKQVIFSIGNLQYKASSNKWQFAENQYDMIGADNANIASNYSGWIDLFGWGTSGYNSKYPYMTSDSENQYGDGANDIAGTDYDWGVFATIANGNNEAWRTLTKAEWEYLLQTRTNAADKWGNATVADVPGLIILPDAWTTPAGLSFAAQQPDWTTNTYSANQWRAMENAGAVFLPAAARRDGTTIMSIDADVRRGYYWTSTANGNGSAYAVRFTEDDPASLINDLRLYGYAVRLARDKKTTEGIESPSLQGRSGEASKVLRNGVLLIEKNGKTYNVLGTRVK